MDNANNVIRTANFEFEKANAAHVTKKQELNSWDVNQDGIVNILDLNKVAENFGQETTPDDSSDVNGDGTTNIFDLVSVGSHFGENEVSAAPPQLVSRHGMTGVEETDLRGFHTKTRVTGTTRRVSDDADDDFYVTKTEVTTHRDTGKLLHIHQLRTGKGVLASSGRNGNTAVWIVAKDYEGNPLVVYEESEVGKPFENRYEFTLPLPDGDTEDLSLDTTIPKVAINKDNLTRGTVTFRDGSESETVSYKVNIEKTEIATRNTDSGKSYSHTFKNPGVMEFTFSLDGELLMVTWYPGGANDSGSQQGLWKDKLLFMSDEVLYVQKSVSPTSAVQK